MWSNIDSIQCLIHYTYSQERCNIRKKSIIKWTATVNYTGGSLMFAVVSNVIYTCIYYNSYIFYLIQTLSSGNIRKSILLINIQKNRLLMINRRSYEINKYDDRHVIIK